MRPANDKTQPFKVAELFNQCMADFVEQGYHGAALFDKLATDPRLPLHFSTQDMACIEHVGADAIRQRRKRMAGPPFLKMGSTVIVWRHDYLAYIKGKYCETGSQVAAE